MAWNEKQGLLFDLKIYRLVRSILASQQCVEQKNLIYSDFSKCFLINQDIAGVWIKILNTTTP